MALLTASDLHKDIAGRPLLRGVSFRLERRTRMTLAGRNGAGKTTLLRMLAGESAIDRGELSVAKGARVALHDQRPPRDRAIALREYVLSGCAEELQIERELAQLEASMAAGDADETLLSRYARAQARLETRGGYLWRDRANAMAHGLGFAEEDLERPLGTFSGGELTRASLARALATGADLLLLDEPTNHLDIDALEWLEQTLQGLDAAIVLVAHDRWFLEAVGTAVLELEAGRSRFLARRLPPGGKERAPPAPAPGRAVRAARDGAPRDGSDGSDGSEGRDGYDGNGRGGPLVLLDGVELWLERGEHVSLVGPNGAGKTTLIETLAGRRELASGKLSSGHNVRIGYLSQHAEELGAGGPSGQSVLAAVQRATALTPAKARALLGRFLFSGEDADKPLDGLSGGERRRLALAILVQSAANVLILDEPTNHLDIESREALEDALSAFPGAVLLVTHDRALLDAVGKRTVAVEAPVDAGAATVRSYLGGWAEFVRVREERREAGEGSANGGAR